MTVASDTNRSGPYNGNGVTTAFDYEFRVLNEGHLRVVHTDATGTETDLTLNSDYTVTGVGDAGGGQVIVTTPPAGASGDDPAEKITILLDVPFTQETDLENQGAYYAETVEAALDLAVMRDQQLQEQIDRSLKIPPSSDNTALDGLIQNVTRLASSADNIDTVADNIASVNTAADNIAEIIAAPANATIATTQAGISTTKATESADARDAAVAAQAAAELARDEAQAASPGAVKVTNADTTLGKLSDKIEVAGDGSAAVTNPGANEKLTITVLGVPIGTTIYVNATSAPAGFLKENGALYSKTTYAALWAFAQASGRVVSEANWQATDWGAFSDYDEDNFRVPDSRGEFVRGLDDGRGVDSGRTLGSFQNHQIQDHTHSSVSGQNGGILADTSSGSGAFYYQNQAISTGQPNSGNHGSETRPRNVSKLACIKYM